MEINVLSKGHRRWRCRVGVEVKGWLLTASGILPGSVVAVDGANGSLFVRTDLHSLGAELKFYHTHSRPTPQYYVDIRQRETSSQDTGDHAQGGPSRSETRDLRTTDRY